MTCRKIFSALVLLLAVSIQAMGQINTSTMINIGRNALYYDDYVLAIKYFNMVIAARPHLYEPYYYRSLAKFYLDDYSGAELDCTKAISRNPYVTGCYLVRGLARINLGLLDEAIPDYYTVVDMEPDNRSAWKNLAICQLLTDHLDAADSISDIMIRKWPKTTDGYCIKSDVYSARNDSVTAEEYIDKAMGVDKYDTQVLYMKSRLLMQREAFADAEHTIDEALKLQPKNSASHINRALCRYHQNNYRGAMEDYDSAIAIDSLSFVGHYNRGLLRANVGEDNLAIEDFNFIIKRDSTDMMAVFNRATLRENIGDYRGAISDYTTVIKEFPKFTYGYQRRAAVRRKVGDIAGANRDEEHVLKEQIAHRYGYSTPTSRQKNKTRKQSDKNLDDYSSLVTEDESADRKYTSEIRGKVQNRNVETTLIKPFARTYNLYIENQTDSAIVFFNKAYDLSQEGDVEGAIDLLTKAIKINPDFAEAYYNRGLLLLLNEQQDAAIKDLSQAGEMGLYSAYSIIKKKQKRRSLLKI